VDPVKGTLALVGAAGGVVFVTITGDSVASDPAAAGVTATVVVGIPGSVAGCLVGFPETTAVTVLAAAVDPVCLAIEPAGPDVAICPVVLVTGVCVPMVAGASVTAVVIDLVVRRTVEGGLVVVDTKGVNTVGRLVVLLMRSAAVDVLLFVGVSMTANIVGGGASDGVGARTPVTSNTVPAPTSIAIATATTTNTTIRHLTFCDEM